MIVFLDTEFTGLGQRWPRLISIGLVSQDGQHEFYAELVPASYLAKCDPWVHENVLPLLEDGDYTLEPLELTRRLIKWINTLGPVQIAIDRGGKDFSFLKSMLDPWPKNLNPQPVLLGGDEFDAALEKSYSGQLRRHHALDDARAHRLAWIGCRNCARMTHEQL